MKTPFLVAGATLAVIVSGCISARKPAPTPPPTAVNVPGASSVTTTGAASRTNNTQRVIRYWHEEKGPDGRTVLVPEDWLVDKNGRVIRKVK